MKTYREFLLEQTQTDILNEMSQKFNVGKTKCEINPFKKPQKGEGQSGRTEENEPHLTIFDKNDNGVQYYPKSDRVIGKKLKIHQKKKVEDVEDKIPSEIKKTMNVVKDNPTLFDELLKNMESTTDLKKTVKDFETK